MAELLTSWGPASTRRRAELRSAEGFPAAVRQTAADLVRLHDGKRLLNLIINDRGRFFVALLALDLHFRRHDEGIGLTPGRLKALCVEQGICSATRTGALLALMKFGGYLEPAPSTADRRRRELVPTAALIAAQRDRWRCHFSAAAPLLPDAERALEVLDQPEFVHGVVRLMSAYFRAGFRFTDYVPALRLFADRNGGMFVIFAMLAAANEGDLVHQTPIGISISGLARSVGSSRAHIIKLLKDAECEGLVERPSLGSIVLMPPLVHDLYEFFALNYLLLTHLGKIARDHGGAAGRSSAGAYPLTPGRAS